MDELELLKKDWKNTDTQFKQVSEQEIYNMLHKKSSSIVKWILIISLIEFVVLNGFGYVVASKEMEKFEKLHPYLSLLEKLNYIILLGFIFLFYKNYQTISVLDSSKKLIKDIIKTRKIVNYYIYWNIIISLFLGSFAFIDGFNLGYYKANPNAKEPSQLMFIVVFIFSMLFVGAFIIGFYKLLYGRLLNKLKKNLNDLKKMEY